MQFLNRKLLYFFDTQGGYFYTSHLINLQLYHLLHAEGGAMRTNTICSFILIFLAVITSSPGPAAEQTKIVVMNPRGFQPEIRKIPMAPRPASLDGETVYIVDTKYPNTKPFVNELLKALKSKYPRTRWVLRDKFGFYMDDDPALWKEIKEKGDGAIVLLGH